MFVSVVGADRVPVVSPIDRAMFGYYASKRAAEVVVESSGVPYTTLRATQFHELLLMAVSALAKSPVVPVPSGFRFQPWPPRRWRTGWSSSPGFAGGLVDDLAGPRSGWTSCCART